MLLKDLSSNLHINFCILVFFIISLSLLTDINECNETNDCDGNASCTNTIGSYDCVCLSGFEGDGFNCSGMFTCPPMRSEVPLILMMHLQTLMSATEQCITVISMPSVVTLLDHLTVPVTWDTWALESCLTAVRHKSITNFYDLSPTDGFP